MLAGGNKCLLDKEIRSPKTDRLAIRLWLKEEWQYKVVDANVWDVPRPTRSLLFMVHFKLKVNKSVQKAESTYCPASQE